MKAVLYARVSSEKQAEKDLSISAQLKALRDYASKHDYQIVREFIDEAESARTADRPSFQEMIALARSKERHFDVVLVWKLSRFARNREDSIIYKSFLRKRGIQVISINEQVDDSPAGLLLEGVIEVIDEFYSANLSQEAKRGLREAVSRGYFPGGTTPIGYKLIEVDDGRAKRKSLALDNDLAPVVKRIFDLCLEGNGSKEIANRLNNENIGTKAGALWTKATILYILKNKIYTGDLVWPSESRLRKGEKQIIHRDHHSSIVNHETFEKVQRIISDRSFSNVHPRRINSNYLLSGILFCESCGKAMLGGTAKSGQYRYYGCYSRLRISDSACDCKPVNSNKIESAIINKLQTHILTEENLAELLRLTNTEIAALFSSSDNQISTLKKQLEIKERKLDKLYDALEEGIISSSDLAPRIARLKDDINQIRGKVTEIELTKALSNQPITISMPQLRKYVADLRSLLLQGKYFEQKTFLKSFVKRIDYNYPQVSIQYTFPVNSSVGKYDEVLAIDKLSGESGTHIEPFWALPDPKGKWDTYRTILCDNQLDGKWRESGIYIELSFFKLRCFRI